MDNKIRDRIKSLKQRTIDYTAGHPTDRRASTIWLDCCADISKDRVIGIDNYEHRMESLEMTRGDDYP